MSIIVKHSGFETNILLVAKFKIMCHMYMNPKANPYQSIFVALYKMSVALSRSSSYMQMFLFTPTQVTKLPQ